MNGLAVQAFGLLIGVALASRARTRSRGASLRREFRKIKIKNDYS